MYVCRVHGDGGGRYCPHCPKPQPCPTCGRGGIDEFPDGFAGLPPHLGTRTIELGYQGLPSAFRQAVDEAIGLAKFTAPDGTIVEDEIVEA